MENNTNSPKYTILLKWNGSIDYNNTTVFKMSPDTVVSLIKDLVDDLRDAGDSKLVLKDSDGRFLIFQLDKHI